MKNNRRQFLKTSTAAAAAVGATAYFPWSEKAFGNFAANDKLGIGCIGMGGMGSGDARQHAGFGTILAVCDVDSTRADKAKNDPNIGKGTADAYKDYRKVLDRKDIDVVSVVTTDPWHVKIAIEALQAGKHVFCQKPLSLTIEENQLMRSAAKKFDKQVVFIGTQQRSTKDLFLRAVNMVQKGLLGDISRVTCSIGSGDKGGPFKKTAAPTELDWDMWLGQCPKVDFIKERCHYQYRWWYEYSGGKFTDWGAHHVDIASWALGLDQAELGPVEIDGNDAYHPVEFKQGYPTVDDSYNTATDYAVKCKFPSGVEMVVTSRGDNGVLFEGSKGKLFVNRGKITGAPVEQKWDDGKFTDEDLKRLYKGKPFEGHKNNFYRCIAEGGLPVSDVYSHIQIMNTCHLAAIAARLGRTIKWDPKAEKMGDDEAQSFVAREVRKGFEVPRV